MSDPAAPNDCAEWNSQRAENSWFLSFPLGALPRSSILQSAARRRAASQMRAVRRRAARTSPAVRSGPERGPVPQHVPFPAAAWRARPAQGGRGGCRGWGGAERRVEAERGLPSSRPTSGCRRSDAAAGGTVGAPRGSGGGGGEVGGKRRSARSAGRWEVSPERPGGPGVTAGLQTRSGGSALPALPRSLAALFWFGSEGGGAFACPLACLFICRFVNAATAPVTARCGEAMPGAVWPRCGARRGGSSPFGLRATRAGNKSDFFHTSEARKRAVLLCAVCSGRCCDAVLGTCLLSVWLNQRQPLSCVWIQSLSVSHLCISGVQKQALLKLLTVRKTNFQAWLRWHCKVNYLGKKFHCSVVSAVWVLLVSPSATQSDVK